MTSSVGSVGWQVDLPGLASLVLNLGTAGLKRFAEAGVDFHTILCMGEIAEQCPASNEYRRELSECRQKQRKQSQWLYKVVEIGAATNFVADELLKRRAGENVVALMSALLPVMSESSCDNLLLKLFEASATPLDKTPGFGQLRCIRETLMPLARKTQFKDKVFQYHSLVRHLLEKSDPVIEMSAYQSIPDEDTAVHLILSLAKLTQQEPNEIIEFDGLNGAGWVIAYARHVLGLPTCILSSASTSLPISGDYRNARVILNIFAKEAKCQLLVGGDIQEFITKPCPATSNGDGWVIDTSRVNVLDSYISQSDPMRKGTSPIARSMVHECTEVLSESLRNPLNISRTPVHGLAIYGQYCLPAVRRKAQKVLGYLGFDPAEADSAHLGCERLSRYLDPVKGKLCDYIQEVLVPGLKSKHSMIPGYMWTKSNLGHIEANEQAEHDSFDATGAKCINYIFRMVYAACRLAFTDWDQHLRLISVSLLEGEEYYLTPNASASPLKNLCQSIIDITVGGRQHTTPSFGEDDLVAFQHRGVVFAHGTALYQNINLDACYIHLVPGGIAFNGEKKYSIFTDPERQRREGIWIADPEPQIATYRPADHFPEPNVVSRVRSSLHGVVLIRNVVIDHRLHTLPRARNNLQALSNVVVTTPCEHSYYGELDFDTITHYEFFKNAVIHQGIQVPVFPGAHWDQHTELEVWLESVDQNPVAQWLATQDFHDPRCFTVIQRDCCMACVFKRIDAALRQDNRPPQFVRIVNGRIAGEDMK
jgi:hypothetical protein